MATKTRWTESETIQVGKDLVGVARRFLDRLADRDITPAFLDECTTILTNVETAAAGQPVRLGEQKGATVAVEVLLSRAATRTGAVRDAIARKFPKRKDVQKSFGVGGPDASGSVKNALSAIDAALGGAASYPSEATAAKILARDLEGLRTLRADIVAADTRQEGAKDGKKGGTAGRNSLLRQATECVDTILVAAGLEFAEEPEILDQFMDPIPSKKKTKTANPDPTPT